MRARQPNIELPFSFTDTIERLLVILATRSSLAWRVVKRDSSRFKIGTDIIRLPGVE